MPRSLAASGRPITRGTSAGRWGAIARFSDLFALPELRGRGYGRALFNAMLSWAKGRVRSPVACQEAPGFYRKLGLKEASLRLREVDPCPDPSHTLFEINFTRRH